MCLETSMEENKMKEREEGHEPRGTALEEVMTSFCAHHRDLLSHMLHEMKPKDEHVVTAVPREACRTVGNLKSEHGGHCCRADEPLWVLRSCVEAGCVCPCRLDVCAMRSACVECCSALSGRSVTLGCCARQHTSTDDITHMAHTGSVTRSRRHSPSPPPLSPPQLSPKPQDTGSGCEPDMPSLNTHTQIIQPPPLLLHNTHSDQRLTAEMQAKPEHFIDIVDKFTDTLMEASERDWSVHTHAGDSVKVCDDTHLTEIITTVLHSSSEKDYNLKELFEQHVASEKRSPQTRSQRRQEAMRAISRSRDQAATRRQRLQIKRDLARLEPGISRKKKRRTHLITHTYAQNLDTPISRSQNPDTPTSHAQNLDTPTSRSQNPDTPISRALSSDTPITHAQNPDTPITHAKSPDKPVSHSQNPDMPITHILSPDTPISHALSPDTPNTYAQNADTPITHAQNPDTPITYAQNPDTPITHAQNPDTPILHSQNPDTPITHILSPDMPISHDLSSDTPNTHSQNPYTPITHSQNADMPVARTLSLDTPNTYAQNPDTPITHAQNPDTPITHAQNPDTPITHAQNPDRPITHAQNPDTPNTHSQNPDTPITHSQDVDMPVARALSPDTPISHTLSPDTPNTHSQNPDTPITHSQDVDMPVARALSPDTQLSCALIPDTPISHEQNRDTPITHSQNPDTPVAHALSPGTPISHALSPGTPISHALSPDTPISHALSPDTPISRALSPDTPISRALSPDTPISHALSPDTPISHALSPDTPISHALSPDTPISHALSPDTPISHALSPDTPISRALSPDTPISRALSPDTPISRALSPDTPISRALSPDTPISRALSPDTPISRALSPDTPISRALSPDTPISRALSPDTPISRALSPDTPISRALSPDTPISRALSPDTPISRALSPDTPISRALSPDTPISRALSPDTPISRALSPDTPISRALSPDTPISRALSPDTPISHALSPDTPILHTLSPDTPISHTQNTDTPITHTQNTDMPMSHTQITNTPISYAQITDTPISQAQLTNMPISQFQIMNMPISNAQITDTPIAQSQITDTPIAHAQITATPIAHAQITARPIAHAQITATPIAHAQITATPIAHAQITATPIAHAQITATPIAHAQITATPIAHAQITATPIAHAQITPIAHAQITATSIAHAQNPNTPITHVQMPDKLFSYLQSTDTPTSHTQSTDTPSLHSQNPESEACANVRSRRHIVRPQHLSSYVIEPRKMFYAACRSAKNNGTPTHETTEPSSSTVIERLKTPLVLHKRKLYKDENSARSHAKSRLIVKAHHSEEVTRSPSPVDIDDVKHASPIKLMLVSTSKGGNGVKYTLRSAQTHGEAKSFDPCVEASWAQKTINEQAKDESAPTVSGKCTEKLHAEEVVKTKGLGDCVNCRNEAETTIRRRPGRPKKLKPPMEKAVKRPIGRPRKSKSVDTSAAPGEDTEKQKAEDSPSGEVGNKNLMITITYGRRKTRRMVSEGQVPTEQSTCSGALTQSSIVEAPLESTPAQISMNNHQFSLVMPVEDRKSLTHSIMCPKQNDDAGARRPGRPAKVKISGISVTVTTVSPRQRKIHMKRSVKEPAMRRQALLTELEANEKQETISEEGQASVRHSVRERRPSIHLLQRVAMAQTNTPTPRSRKLLEETQQHEPDETKDSTTRPSTSSQNAIHFSAASVDSLFDANLQWWPTSASPETLKEEMSRRHKVMKETWVSDASEDATSDEGRSSGPSSSAVRVLFERDCSMDTLCSWFMQTTETQSLAIVKKANNRNPCEVFQYSSSQTRSRPNACWSPQAERLRKCIKKFATVVPKSPMKLQQAQMMFRNTQNCFIKQRAFNTTSHNTEKPQQCGAWHLYRNTLDRARSRFKSRTKNTDVDYKSLNQQEESEIQPVSVCEHSLANTLKSKPHRTSTPQKQITANAWSAHTLRECKVFLKKLNSANTRSMSEESNDCTVRFSISPARGRSVQHREKGVKKSIKLEKTSNSGASTWQQITVNKKRRQSCMKGSPTSPKRQRSSRGVMAAKWSDFILGPAR